MTLISTACRLLLVGSAAGVLIACGSDHNSTTGPTATGSAVPGQSDSASASAAQTSAGGGPLLPSQDAEQTRDRLYDVMKAAPYSESAAPDTVILTAWKQAFPSLNLTLFPGQEVTGTQVSSSQSFLISRAPDSGFDQWFAYAVKDTEGLCAGGVAVIRGEDDKVSDSHRPNSWAKVSFRGECTAETAVDHYRPGTA